jgi:hypothetical protein
VLVKPEAALDSVPHDTDAESHVVQMEIYRRLGPTGRSQAAFRLMALAREIALAGIRARHPHYDEQQVGMALVRLRLGDEAALSVWPAEGLVDP